MLFYKSVSRHTKSTWPPLMARATRQSFSQSLLVAKILYDPRQSLLASVDSTRSIATATTPCLGSRKNTSRREQSRARKKMMGLKDDGLTYHGRKLMELLEKKDGSVQGSGIQQNILPVDIKTAPTVKSGPPVSLTFEETTQQNADMLKELLEMSKSVGPDAQTRIMRDWNIIIGSDEDDSYTMYEFREAVQQAALLSDAQDAKRLAKIMSNDYIKSKDFEFYFDEEMKNVSLETLLLVQEELETYLVNMRHKTSEDNYFRRFEKTLLEEIPTHQKRKFLEKQSAIMFRSERSSLAKGTGKSMEPTLTSPNWSFNVLVGDNLTEFYHLRRKLLVDLPVGVHDRESLSTIANNNECIKPLTTDNIEVGDIVHYMYVDAQGIGRQLGKRVAALEGDIVEFQGRPRRVPKGHFWALGDNAEVSKDSRHHGAVPLSNIRLKTLATWNVEGEPEFFKWFG